MLYNIDCTMVHAYYYHLFLIIFLFSVSGCISGFYGNCWHGTGEVLQSDQWLQEEGSAQCRLLERGQAGTGKCHNQHVNGTAVIFEMLG